MLAALLSSRVLAEMLRILFGLESAPLHLREIERRSDLAVSTIQQELKRLTALDVVRTKLDGNRRLYWANQAHPLYADLRQLVLKTVGLGDMLKAALERLAGVRWAFIFGSFAEVGSTAGSDIDLMVVGQITLRELVRALSGISHQLGRELNPVILSPTEFETRRQQNEHFLATVLASPRIFIKGDEHELGAVGYQRLATTAPLKPSGDRRTLGHRRAGSD